MISDITSPFDTFTFLTLLFSAICLSLSFFLLQFFYCNIPWHILNFLNFLCVLRTLNYFSVVSQFPRDFWDFKSHIMALFMKSLLKKDSVIQKFQVRSCQESLFSEDVWYLFALNFWHASNEKKQISGRSESGNHYHTADTRCVYWFWTLIAVLWPWSRWWYWFTALLRIASSVVTITNLRSLDFFCRLSRSCTLFLLFFIFFLVSSISAPFLSIYPLPIVTFSFLW